ADLSRVRVPAGVHDGARRSDRAVAAESLGQLLYELEALGLAQATAAGDQDVGALDVDVGPALLAALDHGRLGRPRRQLHLDVLDRGAGTVDLRRLERV